jgi:hypothetical protein
MNLFTLSPEGAKLLDEVKFKLAFKDADPKAIKKEVTIFMADNNVDSNSYMLFMQYFNFAVKRANKLNRITAIKGGK